MQDNGKFAGHRDPCPFEAAPLGDLESPLFHRHRSLQPPEHERRRFIEQMGLGQISSCQIDRSGRISKYGDAMMRQQSCPQPPLEPFDLVRYGSTAVRFFCRVSHSRSAPVETRAIATS
jgi:hypothetical protein